VYNRGLWDNGKSLVLLRFSKMRKKKKRALATTGGAAAKLLSPEQATCDQQKLLLADATATLWNLHASRHYSSWKDGKAETSTTILSRTRLRRRPIDDS